tara:strand:- start:11 stop:226 length:216 start_codon:yes stop_codon:yes gene_type:complete
MNYFYGFTAIILTVMSVSASPSESPTPPIVEEIKEQKEVLNKQKDCMKKIQSKQKKIANELTKIRELIKKD